MSELLEIVADIVSGIFMKLADPKPGRSDRFRAVMATLGLLVLLAAVILGGYLSWKNGNETELYMYGSMAAVFVLLFLFFGIRRWKRKKEKEETE